MAPKETKERKKRATGIIDPVAQDLQKKINKAKSQLSEHTAAAEKLRRVIKSLEHALHALDPEKYIYTYEGKEKPVVSWKGLLGRLFQDNLGTEYSPRDMMAYLETQTFYDKCTTSILNSWLAKNTKNDSSAIVKFRRGYYGISE